MIEQILPGTKTVATDTASTASTAPVTITASTASTASTAVTASTPPVYRAKLAPLGGATPLYDYPALCIPRGLGNITHEELTSVINRSGLGEVSKIIIKPKEFLLPKWERTASQSAPDDDRPQTVCYNNIYIYFKKWNIENPTVRKYRDNIINGQTIKIVHKTIPTPIFWRCVAANFNNHHHHRPELK